MDRPEAWSGHMTSLNMDCCCICWIDEAILPQYLRMKLDVTRWFCLLAVQYWSESPSLAMTSVTQSQCWQHFLWSIQSYASSFLFVWYQYSVVVLEIIKTRIINVQLCVCCQRVSSIEMSLQRFIQPELLSKENAYLCPRLAQPSILSTAVWTVLEH